MYNIHTIFFECTYHILSDFWVFTELCICDWILENRSKSHIRSFEINYFKDLKPLQLAKASKHEYENYTKDELIYHLSDNLKNFWLLSKFPAKKDRKSDLLHC